MQNLVIAEIGSGEEIKITPYQTKALLEAVTALDDSDKPVKLIMTTGQVLTIGRVLEGGDLTRRTLAIKISSK
jgi:hypothetical protein